MKQIPWNPLVKPEDELGNYEKIKEFVYFIAESTGQSSHASESVSKLEANEPLWTFWQEILTKYSGEQPHNNSNVADS